jgi:hypothetical protein
MPLILVLLPFFCCSLRPSLRLCKKMLLLIREAVDRFIDQAGHSRREAVLHKAAGIWKGRTDIPDFKATRAEWDRN